MENSLDTARSMLTATNSLLPYSLSTDELGKRNDLKSRSLAIAELLLSGIKA